jgi:hypothetical protein
MAWILPVVVLMGFVLFLVWAVRSRRGNPGVSNATDDPASSRDYGGGG